ncbi:post-GPI attachment to proteins factor 2 [Sardina pilchardus]|uniref:post-GPI attachment to proteins factor 2 n=1 Tax=Sardina pilchardus TaxID=27697 RepID=UPI002E13DED7
MHQIPFVSLDRDRPLIRLQFTHFAVATVSLPLIGFIGCVVTSLLYNFNEATYTHCQVPNYLPSISAAINLTPERYVWRFCIGLHSAPRVLMAFAYFFFYKGKFLRLPERLLSGLTLLASLSENVGLLVLTYVSSTENYTVHKKSFIAFIAGSIIYMICTCRLWQVIKRQAGFEERKSFRYKWRIFLFNISFLLGAGYFFWRHNKYCEPGIYTLFALCEYLVVLSNMAFHMTAYLDFGNKEVMIATPPESKHF